MKYETWRTLQALRERQGKEYGKLVQKLLALAFIDAGASRITDRSVQGIDIELQLGDRKLALEVKTAEISSISVGKKDLDGLASRREEGFETMLAVFESVESVPYEEGFCTVSGVVEIGSIEGV